MENLCLYDGQDAGSLLQHCPVSIAMMLNEASVNKHKALRKMRQQRR